MLVAIRGNSVRTLDEYKSVGVKNMKRIKDATTVMYASDLCAYHHKKEAF